MSACGKYDSSRRSAAAAPGGIHWPIAPHGAGSICHGWAADAIGLATSRKSTGPIAMPGRPTMDTTPTITPPMARIARPMMPALTR